MKSVKIYPGACAYDIEGDRMINVQQPGAAAGTVWCECTETIYAWDDETDDVVEAGTKTYSQLFTAAEMQRFFGGRCVWEADDDCNC